VRSEVLSGAPDRAAAAHRRPHDDPRLIADDEALLRMAFSMFLEAQSDLAPVGEAEDGATAIRLAADPRPDVVLMDVRMPGTDGIEATRQIIQTCPQTRVLILTTFDLDEYAFAGLKAEASGFLLRTPGPRNCSPRSAPWPRATRWSPLASPAACWRNSARASPTPSPLPATSG
jgi:CheY-like chemotaxis protein